MFGYDPRHDIIHRPLFNEDEEYKFDTMAREKTRKEISEKVPQYILKVGNISFKDFYQKNCNYTTADSKIFKEALQPRMDNNDIEFISNKGAKRQKSNAIQGSDLIKSPMQGKLFFFS